METSAWPGRSPASSPRSHSVVPPAVRDDSGRPPGCLWETVILEILLT